MHLDWTTLLLQTINVLVLLWLLQRFLWRPVVAIVARRQAEATRLLEDAEAARRQALEEKEALAAARAGIAREREAVLAEARRAAEAERDAILAQGQAEIARLRAEAEAGIAHERAALEAALAAEAGRLAVAIARRLLARLPPAATFELFLDGLQRAVAGLPEATRAGLAGEPVELVTAAPLGEAEAQRAAALLAEALGRDGVRLSFRVDPDLIAGVELRAPHLVVRNNWAADLERIETELTGDDHRNGSSEPLARAGQRPGERHPARAQDRRDRPGAAGG
ncbi:F0F1 ATP synthase subunit delta [Benzoatithermus flavus]|uniref:ATP synthase subunit b n=1 Tax=Benzoatithermus flavus TaxID=3108223 RepID=A0ABU8XVH0_9PROT